MSTAAGAVKAKVNPDLQKERDSATFNTEELTYFIDGGEKKTRQRREILETIFSDPAFCTTDKYYQDMATRYDASMLKAVKLMTLAVERGWSQAQLVHVGAAIRYEIPMSIHAVMFVPTIERLATDEQQEEWLPRAMRFEMVGTYAQTELGHGTNVRELETTATYDPVTQEFVMNTPLPSGMKWWPGGLGKSANHAIVLAQTVVSGRKHGIQAFMVQLRDLASHRPLPGVEVGEIGPKIGLNAADNGFLILRNLRIPRTNMLMRYVQVTPGGEFVRSGAEKAAYGTMMLVRANIVMASYQYLAQAVTIATRYSAVRHQSELDPAGPEPQIMDFLTQQYKLFPALALAYAILFAKQYMLSYYERIYETEIQQGDFSSVPELHSQSSGLKAYTSDVMTAAVETCRRACGGHGYLLQSGLCDLYGDSLGSVTYEGENTVMYLQVARYLVKAVVSAGSGSRLAGSASYLQAPPPGPALLTRPRDLLQPQTLTAVMLKRAYAVVIKAVNKYQATLRSGSIPQHEAWNQHSVELVDAARAHCDSFVAINFIDGVNNAKVSPPLRRVLTLLSQLHALHRINESRGDYAESGALTMQQLDWARDLELQLLPQVRPDAVALVDAFDWRDETLGSTIGCYDGNVYERMLAMSKRSPLNQQDVMPAIHKYLKPFTAKFMPDAKL